MAPDTGQTRDPRDWFQGGMKWREFRQCSSKNVARMGAFYQEFEPPDATRALFGGKALPSVPPAAVPKQGPPRCCAP